MSIYKSAVYKPITTIMIFLAVIVFGLYSVTSLPIDLYPEIEPPFVSILTTYPGASASDIETNVTRLVEDALNSVDKLKELSSRSTDNISVVFAEFEWGANLDEAVNDIRSSLSWIEDFLPEDCNDPSIFKFNTSMMPILFYGITANQSYAGIEKILDEQIVTPLNRIDGIGSIGFAGLPKREIIIEVDPQKLESYGVSVEDIGNIIRAENFNMPIGALQMGAMDYSIRIEGEFKDSDRIKDLALGSFMGRTIYIRDVADVRDGLRTKTIDQKINGETGIQMFVMKQSGANTVKIADQVKRQLTQLQKNLPADIQIIEVFDSSTFINYSIGNLTRTLLWALLFVSLVVLFFLGRWRATFIVVLTIPVSLIVSFIYLKLSGNSINIISLSALSIAIGMVVDDAIVVLENISRHIDRGARPREAAIYATNEVWLAVIVTTLTVVAVFFPLTMLTGFTGILFGQLGWIVTITVVTSTIAAITLTPMLSALLLRYKPKKQNAGKFSYDTVVINSLDKLDVFYGKAINWALHHKKTVIFSSLGILILSVIAVGRVGTEFIPETDQSAINISAELQTGIRLERTIEVKDHIEALFRELYPEIKVISSSAGSDEDGGMEALFGQNGSHTIEFRMQLVQPTERTRNVWDIADDMRSQMERFAEIELFTINTDGAAAFGGGGAIQVQIFGYDIETTNALARQISDSIQTVEGARDVTVSRKKEKPELKIVLDQEKMAMHALNTATVATALRNRIHGFTASRFREQGNEYDIIVRFPEERRNSISMIENIAIKNMMGNFIRLQEFAEVQEHWSPPNIERRGRQRLITISVTPYGVPLGEVSAQIQSKLDAIEVPSDVYVSLGGAFEDMQESFKDLALLLLLVIALVYIVMAAQFESLKMPIIIMLSIPFAFSGVFFALFFTGKTFSVIAALGLIMLIGIVVKNAIVLVDYINLLRERGYELYAAISEAGRTRLRPVLMTAATTILGMMPLALSTGEGSEVWSPMGIAVIGGLLFSTLVTLLIVPVGYGMMVSRTLKNKRKQIEAELDALHIS